MTARELPVEEWGKLAHLDLGLLLPACDPQAATVLVVEQDSQIIGCWAAITILHAEGIWVHPDHRKKASVVRRLWTGMHRIAERLGVSSIVTGAADPSVRALIERHQGQELPPAFVMPLKGL